jgi:Phage T4 tail fibre
MKKSVNTTKYFNFSQLKTKSKKTRNLFLVIAGMLGMCSYGQTPFVMPNISRDHTIKNYYEINSDLIPNNSGSTLGLNGVSLSGMPNRWLIGNAGSLSFRNQNPTNDPFFDWETSFERLTISQDGNVGIGTASPIAQLHLADISDAGGRNLLIGDDTFFSDIDVPDALGLYANDGGSTKAGLKLGSNGEFIWGRNGSIGIGTDNPQYKLDVNGTAGFSRRINIGGTIPVRFDNVQRNRNIVLWQVSDNDNEFHGFGLGNGILRYQIPAVANNAHVFYAGTGANSSQELMRIQGNGYVAIGGIDNPQALLQIADKFDAGGRNLQIGDDTFFSDIDVTDALGLYPAGNTSTKAGLKLGSDGEFIWGRNGRIGIGTDNPQHKLDVNGNAKISNTFIGDVGHGVNWACFSHSSSNNVGGYALTQRSNGLETYLNAASGGSVGIRVGNYSKVIIKDNGNVGIGTDIPDSKLSVKGTVKALDYALVTSESMPDYVFNSDYKLPSLQETEAYIKNNKHLPYFKSAKEMEANGYSLQEMDKGLLQSLEEMTLHSIAQEKETSAQKIQIQALAAELASIKAALLSHK